MSSADIDAAVSSFLASFRPPPSDFLPLSSTPSLSFDPISSSSTVGNLGTSFGSYIDHTILAATATPSQVTQLVEDAIENGFKAVCVNSIHAPLVNSLIEAERSSRIHASPSSQQRKPDLPEIAVVVGFPLGQTSTAVTVFETKWVIQQGGATEIDMVISVGHLKAKDYAFVYRDIKSVVDAAREVEGGKGNAIVKVIIEAALLTDEEKAIACFLSKHAGAGFVKTSTGFSTLGGAKVDDVRLMKWVASEMGENLGKGKEGGEVFVKAAGGIRKWDDFEMMRRAGADRIGCSSSLAILEEGRHNQ